MTPPEMTNNEITEVLDSAYVFLTKAVNGRNIPCAEDARDQYREVGTYLEDILHGPIDEWDRHKTEVQHYEPIILQYVLGAVCAKELLKTTIPTKGIDVLATYVTIEAALTDRSKSYADIQTFTRRLCDAQQYADVLDIMEDIRS